jgi:hypothetical protein
LIFILQFSISNFQAQVHPTYQRVEPIRPSAVRTTQLRTAAVPAMRQIAAPTAVASVSPSSASLNPNASDFVPTRTPTAEQSGVEASPATPQAATPATTTPVTASTTTSTAPAVSPAATAAAPPTVPVVEATPSTSGATATITQAATPAAAAPATVTPAATTPQVVTPTSTPATAPKLHSVEEIESIIPSSHVMPGVVAQPGPSSMTASVAPTMKR